MDPVAPNPQDVFRTTLPVGTSLIVVFVPSKDQDGEPINQDYWVSEVLQTLGRLFRGRRPTGVRCVSTLACSFGVGLAHWLWWMHPALSTRRGPRPTFERLSASLGESPDAMPV